MAQQTINKLLRVIDDSLTTFVENLPESEKYIYSKVLSLVKELKVDNYGNIRNTLENVKLIGKIKNQLDGIVISEPYLKNVSSFVSVFEQVAVLNNDYLARVFSDFKPKPVLNEIKKQAIAITADQLTEGGIGNQIKNDIVDVLQANISTGGSYANFTDQLRTAIIGKEGEDSPLLKYAKQVATDSINQYNAQYVKAVTNDLGLEWFQYLGSLLTTSRQFCKSMVEKRYFHISEVPELLHGHIDGKNIPVSSKTGLPYGLIDGTNETNFFIYRGGYQCGHQIFPVSSASVPSDLVAKFA